MSRRRALWSGAAVILAMAVVVVHAADAIRITPIMRDQKVFVSFELTNAYDEAIKQSIASGLRTTFSYDVALRVVAWVDRTIATIVVSTSDQYDNLTRQHRLTRTVDGRVDDALVTDDESVAREWLTTWKRLELCDTKKLDATRDYYVRVSARARPTGGSLLGWAASITGQSKFTFIP
jgi:Domain of unknown function (DUF4390)